MTPHLYIKYNETSPGGGRMSLADYPSETNNVINDGLI